MNHVHLGTRATNLKKRKSNLSASLHLRDIFSNCIIVVSYIIIVSKTKKLVSSLDELCRIAYTIVCGLLSPLQCVFNFVQLKKWIRRTKSVHFLSKRLPFSLQQQMVLHSVYKEELVAKEMPNVVNGLTRRNVSIFDNDIWC